MEFAIGLWLVLGFVVFVFVALRSKRAKEDLHGIVRLPDGVNVHEFTNQLISDLPSGWVPLGAKKSQVQQLLASEWDLKADGGNIIDIVSGVAWIGRLFVVSVDFGVEVTDEFGRTKDVSFEECEPQQEYKFHVWVSFAGSGQGKMWGPLTSHKILTAKQYLAEKLTASQIQ